MWEKNKTTIETKHEVSIKTLCPVYDELSYFLIQVGFKTSGFKIQEDVSRIIVYLEYNSFF